MSQQFNNNASAVSGNTSEDENVCGIAENYIIEIRQMVCAVIIYTKKQLLPRIVFVFARFSTPLFVAVGPYECASMAGLHSISRLCRTYQNKGNYLVQETMFRGNRTSVFASWCFASAEVDATQESSAQRRLYGISINRWHCDGAGWYVRGLVEAHARQIRELRQWNLEANREPACRVRSLRRFWSCIG